MISSGGVGRRFLRCPRQKWAQRRTARQSWLDLLDQSAQRLDDLGVAAPNPFDLERFLGQLMQLRGREILLTPISVRAHSATVCGYCLRLVDRDHVFYTHSRSLLHRTHNAVHELAHLMLGHRSVAPVAKPGLVTAGAGGSGEQGSGWLGLATDSYSERCEDEADAAAAILLGQWHEPAPPSWLAHSTMCRGSARLADAFA